MVISSNKILLQVRLALYICDAVAARTSLTNFTEPCHISSFSMGHCMHCQTLIAEAHMYLG